jgi:hypothetical protein
MVQNLKFYKLKFIHDFLCESAKFKQQLLDELIIYGTDLVRYPRRIRMLSQLCEYESQILKKIEMFETNDVTDLELAIIRRELYDISNRSA